MKMQKQEYSNWIVELKSKVRSSQIKAALAVNSALIHFYWELGNMIAEKENVWGSKLIEQVAKDLKDEFPEIKGLSRTNIFNCKQFYNFYYLQIVQQAVGLLKNETEKTPVELVQQAVEQIQNKENEQLTFVQQLVGQIPWGHNIFIFTKSKNINEALFYIQKTIENNWSRNVLDLQIKSDLYNRQGKSINNFKNTLPEPFSDLANQTLKDPYIFDFLTLSEGFKEKDIEKQLVTHISKFLLELGKGFAFIGQQYHLEIAQNDYYIDLLFYHTKLKCYVVIELKNTKFMPEYAGKLNFYLSAVDSLIKDESDNATIGILLCKDKNNIEAEFALRDVNKPIGISEINFTEIVPDNLKSSLPTIEEIEAEFKTI
ncbi:PDDEXK nuclease domain-containing protein [Flavobacterium sp. NG2]|uniref:PDDEXK nuclease domain-containing protein n=1 Tax=Flavobacterium sp. NG2 TaxID=3097547 RepID=UPI002A7FF94C|nr:PDDEXK nuclease domain-containing protein [Flavobacterium sp. NG2]WPR71982.1 PDDEXK nuclease domain-containing protein [Flavobacterium sp. NG2]